MNGLTSGISTIKLISNSSNISYISIAFMASSSCIFAGNTVRILKHLHKSVMHNTIPIFTKTRKSH